jgi:hypothetical protein
MTKGKAMAFPFAVWFSAAAHGPSGSWCDRMGFNTVWHLHRSISWDSVPSHVNPVTPVA